MSDVIINPEESSKRILIIDSQILDAVQSCGFYTFLNFIKHYRPNSISPFLERGDLGHVMMAAYYMGKKNGIEFEELKRIVADVGREHYQSLELPVETCEWVIQTFYQYAEHFEMDGWTPLKIEETFIFKLYEDDEVVFYYQGKKDLVAKAPKIGKVVADHKFRGVMAQYGPLDNQYIGYAIDEDVDVVYVNEIGLQTSKKPADKFRRVPVNIGEKVKRDWISNTIYWCKTLDFYIQNNIWPRQFIKSPPQYTSKCSKCQYHPICESYTDEEQVTKIKELYHIGEKWDVTKLNEGETKDE